MRYHSEADVDKSESFASMERVIAFTTKSRAGLFINHDKQQTGTPKLLPDYYDW
jgi:hypothetical protein